ncbi:MAG: hypothetical protein ACK47B_16595 [Armatimonadota bacterium]
MTRSSIKVWATVAAVYAGIGVLRFRPWEALAAKEPQVVAKETLKVGFLPVT